MRSWQAAPWVAALGLLVQFRTIQVDQTMQTARDALQQQQGSGGASGDGGSGGARGGKKKRWGRRRGDGLGAAEGDIGAGVEVGTEGMAGVGAAIVVEGGANAARHVAAGDACISALSLTGTAAEGMAGMVVEGCGVEAVEGGMGTAAQVAAEAYVGASRGRVLEGGAEKTRGEKVGGEQVEGGSAAGMEGAASRGSAAGMEGAAGRRSAPGMEGASGVRGGAGMGRGAGVVVDAFCGVGGTTIHLAKRWPLVLAIDTSLPRLAMLQHNLSLCWPHVLAIGTSLHRLPAHAAPQPCSSLPTCQPTPAPLSCPHVLAIGTSLPRLPMLHHNLTLYGACAHAPSL
ncbi:unnamed protein product [Closterium sp. NIES-65]|nr:unnamed protein product [Closterium sp. NIES-65]